MHREEDQRTCAYTVLKSSSLILEFESFKDGNANQSMEYFGFIIITDTTSMTVRLQEVKKRLYFKTFWRRSHKDRNRSQPKNCLELTPGRLMQSLKETTQQRWWILSLVLSN